MCYNIPDFRSHYNENMLSLSIYNREIGIPAERLKEQKEVFFKRFKVIEEFFKSFEGLNERLK